MDLSGPSSMLQVTRQKITANFPVRNFYIGGKNGVALVENSLVGLGMERTFNKSNYFLKWVECMQNINYQSFNEGRQMVNHIPNISCITTKTGLLKTLEEYERFTRQRMVLYPKKKPFALEDFFMQSFQINDENEQREFFRIFKPGDVWICKPSGCNQGKGIFLVDSLEVLSEKLAMIDRKATFSRRKHERIIQRYITHPLLINNRKFDVRAFMLIASVQPCLAFYHHGYVRVSCVPYTNDTTDLTAHLTNQCVQKKHPLYEENKEHTVLSFSAFNEYINSTTPKYNDWVDKQFQPRMKEIMVTCLQASHDKLDKRKGMFDLLGFDFMVDENMKVWLIEVNINPALHTNCSVLQNILPPLVEETLRIAVEVFDKKSNVNDPLKCLRRYQPIYNSATGYIFKNSNRRRHNTCMEV